MRKVFLLITYYLLLTAFMGCATIFDGAKRFAGISTRVLEKGRKTAIVKTYNYDYSTCYTKTLDILKELKYYIYAQNIKKHMIAVYVSEEDTTPVGFFFKGIDTKNTQIEVSSPSRYAKELIAKRVFVVLAGLPDPEEKLKPKEGEQKEQKEKQKEKQEEVQKQ